MRLTLRTLLAWRDGLLDGPEREELAARVTDGSVAQGLLDRMQALEKRDDVEVPRLEGRGLAVDANTVAEYLENTLDPEKLEAFERICLESDRHLTEVSECHRLLAEPLPSKGPRSESPALVAAIEARLAGGLTADAPRQPAAPLGRLPQEVADVPQPQIHINAKTPAPDQPRPKRREAKKGSPWFQVAVAVGLLCLAGGGLGVMLWWNPSVRENVGEPERVAATRPDLSVDRAADAVVRETAPSPPDQPADAPPTPADDSEVGAVATADRAEESLPSTARESGGLPEHIESDDTKDPVAGLAAAGPAAPEPPLGVGPSVPMGDALAIAAPLAPGPDALLPPQAAPAPPSAAAAAGGPASRVPDLPTSAAAGVLNEGPFVLVSSLEQPGQWRACLPGDALVAGLQVLAPPAAQPELTFGDVVVQLAPRSQLALRSTGGDGAEGHELELVFGKAVVRRTTGTAKLTLRAGGLQWELTGPPSAALVEVALSRPDGGDPGSDARVTATLTALEGGLAWSPLAGSAPVVNAAAQGVLAEGAAAVWSSISPAEAAVGAAVEDAWVAGAEKPGRLQAAAVASLASRLRDQDDALAAIRSFVASRRVEDREVAAGTLALVGDYGAAVRLLCEDAVGERLGEHRWRSFERDVVPLALARGIHSAERLQQALSNQLGADEGEQVFRLAKGLTDQQLEDGDGTLLVAALSDSSLVVRRYAALKLEEIVIPGPRDRLRYRADAAVGVRSEGVRWWAIQLEKGLIQRAEAGQLSAPDPG